MLCRAVTFLPHWGIPALVLLVTLSGCRQGGTPAAEARGPLASEPFTASEVETIRTLSPLPDVPDDPTNDVSGDPAAAHLGRSLFFAERLSADGGVSCASCHRPNHGFSVPTRLGEGQEKTPRHPPSLLNTAYNKWYDWDGKADSLWAQAFRPLESPAEHGFSRTEAVRLVADDPALSAAYEAVFGPLPDVSSKERFPPGARPVPDDPDAEPHRAWMAMTDEDRRTVDRVFTDLLKAIAAYEEKLVAGEAPFDRYVEGLQSGDAEKLDAISPAAKRGLKLFVGRAQCINCHNGPELTDRSFHNLGLGPRPWLEGGDEGRWKGVTTVKESRFNATGSFSDAPEGRAADWIRFLKRTPEDHGQFKTPSLRNVELTPPYMHGGHFGTLEEVVEFYSVLDEQPRVGHREEMLEPLGLTDREIDDLVAFLRSLTGESLPAHLRTPPDSPIPPDSSVD